MASQAETGLRGAFARSQALIFPVLIVASVLVLVAPLPPVLMDLLLSCNITISVVILLTTVYVSRPLDFSVFPSVLLGTTMARLVLNVASVRLILTRGAEDGTAAAGHVIQAFGEFVAGGQLFIGVTIFAILIAIQFLVITKGATRISEVAARFALDGMPGKQMAIDADLNAGLVTQEVARKRRAEVTEQADFYGSMDGASKFVRGDAIAGIVITLVNILAGFGIGVFKHGMTLSRAMEVYTTLTIGDGLVSQVPAFLISLAAGLIVTRTSTSSNLPNEIVSQMLRYPQALGLASVFLFAMAFSGLPTVPLLTMSGVCGVMAFTLSRGQKTAANQKKQEETQKTQKRPEPRPEDNLTVDPLELELGVGLIRLADPASGGDLLERVTRVRHRIAQELGIILPKVRIRDNIRLEQRQYQVKIRDVPIAWGEIYSDALLAIDTGATSGEVPGIATKEPAFGRPARWIEQSQKERAELLGYNVVEPSAVVITHLTEVVRMHSYELLTRQQVHQLLDNLKQTAPKAIEELIPDLLKIAQVHQVLNNLLREQVPIRDLETILETLGHYADKTKDLGILTEYVRHSLARTICQRLRDKNRVLHVVTIDPALEDVLAAGFDYSDRGLVIKLSPQVSEAVTRAIANELTPLVSLGRTPIVLCSPQVRAGLKQITSSALPKLAVVSLNEITRDTEVESSGQVSVDALEGHLAAAA
ncbi:MAG TPA: flagellar biosynthesis protein FlhA [Planctomycetaceae bacterium]|jgi:flagellar biosynthesis protein FlhA|nr:flagellar biosynthesis protein FlhA [Planctomycetaceae bacterium]